MCQVFYMRLRSMHLRVDYMVDHHELTNLIAAYLEEKYPGEFKIRNDAPEYIVFPRCSGYPYFFVGVQETAVGFFKPEDSTRDMLIEAADPKLFDYIDKYAALYMDYAQAGSR